jgi:transcriptional regulator with XRE-family HTH domain
MSQRALAAATGITQQNISRLELGHSNGDPESWRSMEAVLRIPVAELMERD